MVHLGRFALFTVAVFANSVVGDADPFNLNDLWKSLMDPARFPTPVVAPTPISINAVTSIAIPSTTSNPNVVQPSVPFAGVIDVADGLGKRTFGRYFGLQGNQAAVVNTQRKAIPLVLSQDGVLGISGYPNVYFGVPAKNGARYLQLFNRSPSNNPPAFSGWSNNNGLTFPGASLCYTWDQKIVLAFSGRPFGCTPFKVHPNYDPNSYNPTVPISTTRLSTSAAPLPTPTGSIPLPSINATTPVTGTVGGSCNSPGDRSKWCNGRSISTDYYNEFSTGDTCSYEFTVTNTTLAYDSTARLTFAINGQSPGPLIECNWGDLVKIHVINNMQDNATSIHWHGIRQLGTNDQDGVPGITECGIPPGQSRTYTWRASSYGTSWYHSHLLSQLGDGLRGPIIIHGPATANYDLDMGTVMINDVFPVTAAQQAIRIGHSGNVGTSNYVLNGNNPSPDLSTGKHSVWSVVPGKKHLFRFINGASQDSYSLRFDNHTMTVIAADFVPIVPYQTEWLNIANGQRYDVILTANQPNSTYFLRAVTQTGCPSGSINNGLSDANGIIQYAGAALNLPSPTFGSRNASTFATCNDEPLASLVPYLKKGAGTVSAFKASVSTMPGGSITQRQTSRDGVVFTWWLNDGYMDVNYTQPTLQTLATNANQSLISNALILPGKQRWVYFVIKNQFFASHPLHLHGHDMSILGIGVGNFTDVNTLNFVNPARRDTVMLVGSRGPGYATGYTVIGFETDNPGAWIMHCHIVWHVENGLALQFIERPDDIDAKGYVNKQEFKDECKAMAKYDAMPGRGKPDSVSGLKRGLGYGQSRAEDVVRRNKHLKRHTHGHLGVRHGMPAS